jgi:membrane protein DedA with SNARE-associated domain
VHSLQAWLTALPAFGVAGVVALVVGLESMGLPLPGEVTLITAALISAAGGIDPWWVAAAAAAGAIAGDSIGYAIGRRGGRRLLERLGRRFPRTLGPPHLARAEEVFARAGAWAVFFGRFVALLRILAGPLAGALKMPYPKFLVANATGGVVWASTTTFMIFFAGKAAERWLKEFSWAALVVAVVVGLALTGILKYRAARAMRAAEEPESTPEPAAPAAGQRPAG